MKFSKNKDKEENKFVQIIKKKWIINGTLTFLLVAIIIASFIALNFFMQNLNLIPIDLSQEQLYTLSEDSKNKVKDVNKEVFLYFIGFPDDDSTVDLARQYNSINKSIKVETVNATSRPDLVSKYGIENGSEGIIVSSGEKYKVLATTDLYTYDSTTYETIDITEEKLTSAIMNVITDKVPKVYFLQGYSDSYSLSYNMQYLSVYLSNEVTQVENLDILTVGKVPDDCDTLMICTPTKDFDDIATNAIIDYINSGRNILWLNAASGEESNLPNVNKILALYGVNPFTPGYIFETDSSKMLSQTPYIIVPDMEYSKVTKNLMNGTGVRFITATKINIADNVTLENLSVEESDILKTSDKSYFRTNINNQNFVGSEGDEKGAFVVGTELTKTLKPADEEAGTSAVKSKLLIYGENNFITDYPINNSTPILILGHNKDLILNSMAYLVDREEDITVRKSTGTVRYTATEEQNTIIRAVIFSIPVLIIFAGILVWFLRRRKK